VPGLFARNERVVCVFDTEYGPFVNVLVGATIVGSMATVWHGVVNPPRTASIREWNYDDQDIRLAKGEEMGRFLLGSTVVMLFPRNIVAFHPDWAPAKPVRLGEAMASYVGAQSPLERIKRTGCAPSAACQSRGRRACPRNAGSCSLQAAPRTRSLRRRG